MRLLIDGYNLMYAAGFTHALQDERGLQRSRQALLGFLAATLTPSEAAETVIVFDAAGAPPGLPAELEYHGMRVFFARNHAEADDLIEELIRADHSPKQLTVVSGDHRLHKAAKRRKATPVDSEAWFEQLERRGRTSGQEPPRPSAKPTAPLSPAEVERWTALFSDEKLHAIIEEESKRPATRKPGRKSSQRKPAAADPPVKPKSAHPSRSQPQRGRKQSPEKPPGGHNPNPFPPGYADDVDFDI
ncbi:MAG: NYN domain-containing protein [Pirellulales bacterium]